jgi:hypothetical protein
MPIHDWTRVRANRFHAFHQSWTIRIMDALNAGLLPKGYLALAEQKTEGPEPDVITLSRPGAGIIVPRGTAVLDKPPKTRMRIRCEATGYARKANRLAIRHPDGELVSIIEIVSPGNKDSRRAIGMLTRKVARYLNAGIHVLIVDLFPPNKRNPQGIHKEIWDWFHDEPFEPPADKPLTLAAYSAGLDLEAFVEPVAVGDILADMPIFLDPERYVPCPLESTYMASWDAFPDELKEPLLAVP